MSNNNHLYQQQTVSQYFCSCNSETHLTDSFHEGSLKDKDIFLKSQISLADTTCDQNSPIFHKFQDIIADEQSFSFTEFNLEESHHISEQDGICNDYLENGFCMRGVECGKMHSQVKDNQKMSLERSSYLPFILNQMPEILFNSKRRTGSFLG